MSMLFYNLYIRSLRMLDLFIVRLIFNERPVYTAVYDRK